MPYPYDNLVALPNAEKAKLLKRDGRVFHVIFAEQFDLDFLDRICNLATVMRRISKTTGGARFLQTLLADKSALLYFTQPSTRTFLSHVRACQHLGIRHSDVRDPRTSSFVKGESDIDGVRTFSSYFDIIIMRHVSGDFVERVAYLMNDINRTIPVINAGAGTREHPTQAILDIYTLRRSFEHRSKGINGIHVAFVGDVHRGRTVNSLARLLCLYDDVKLTFVAPDELQVQDEMKAYLDERGVRYECKASFRDDLAEFDAVYMTRIQDEYDTAGESKHIDYSPYSLTLPDVEKMKDSAIVMHPLPRRDELATEIDQNHRAMYWRQERNGMWARAALICYIFGYEGHVLDYVRKGN